MTQTSFMIGNFLTQEFLMPACQDEEDGDGSND